MESEIWKQIPGYEGLYEASDLGRIRTDANKTTHSARYPERHWKQRILKTRGHNPTTGYRVSLWKDGEEKDWLVARLIAMTFIRVPSDSDTVNHIDGDRFNNKVENLEWVSIKENIQKGFETGLFPQKPVYLIDKKLLRVLSFRSQSEASRFLGKNTGYINGQLKKGKFDFGRYKYAEIKSPFSI